ncbi:MAG: signal peptide peptidase SppA, partial [Bacteroidales bacterium]|nr:signal peptide peptidase SppA [Bacteroidales bacterium]
FATLLAIVVALLILILISVGSLSALFSTGPSKVKIKPGSVLVLDLNQKITDRSLKTPMDALSIAKMSFKGTLGLYDILQNLDKAADDPNITGVLIKSYIPRAGISTMDEIRQALVKFSKSGKFIYAYSSLWTQTSYYVASAADKIFMNPEGYLEFKGLRSEIMFYKKALDKLGIEVQVVREGKYKSAVEPYLRQSMSPENREQINAYIQTVWSHMLAGISDSRDLSTKELNRLADGWIPRTPQTALKSGLIDSLLYEDQVLDFLKDRSGAASSGKLQMVSMSDYSRVPVSEKREYTPDRIAVIYGSGTIAKESFGIQGINADLAKTFRKVRKNNKIKAVVFRVNSPGGDAVVSDQIRREVELTARVKPVIVSMGDLAASGGYMISAPATRILANTTTITGSIGAFGTFPTFQKLMNDKLGIYTDGVQTNRLSAAGSPYKPMSQAERSVFEDLLGQTYQHFVNGVAAGRHMSPERVNELGQGRIWSGASAVKLKLADEIGGLSRAIEVAAQEANLTNYRIRQLPALEDPVNKLVNELLGRTAIRATLISEIPLLQELHELTANSSIQTRLPFRLEIH